MAPRVSIALAEADADAAAAVSTGVGAGTGADDAAADGLADDGAADGDAVKAEATGVEDCAFEPADLDVVQAVHNAAHANDTASTRNRRDAIICIADRLAMRWGLAGLSRLMANLERNVAVRRPALRCGCDCGRNSRPRGRRRHDVINDAERDCFVDAAGELLVLGCEFEFE